MDDNTAGVVSLGLLLAFGAFILWLSDREQ